jgi:hypothetical protein
MFEIACVLFVVQKFNFSQALYKLPADGRRPKHVGAKIMCNFM